MSIPFFYIPDYIPDRSALELDENTSSHIVQVLRMKNGEQIHLTDGKGHLLTAEISEAHKKHCEVRIVNKEIKAAPEKKVIIAISLLKNTSRFEWFLEKATEIGVSEIIPLICARTEKEKFRYERMHSICVSAMLQSQQVWIPVLHQTEEFSKVVNETEAIQKFIAFCEDSTYRKTLSSFTRYNKSIILVGPEGDFTQKEVALAIDKSFTPVTLGDNRLRTETAGVVAAVMLLS